MLGLLGQQRSVLGEPVGVGPCGLEMGDWSGSLHGHGREEDLRPPIVVGELGLDLDVDDIARDQTSCSYHTYTVYV